VSTSDRSRPDGGLAPVTDLFGARRQRIESSPSPSQSSSDDVPRPGDWRPPVTGTAGRTANADAPAADAGGGYSSDAADERKASVFSFVDGAELDPDDAPRPLEDQRVDAERYSMRALGRRGVSSSEMRTLLAGHDLDPGVVEDEIARLERVGLLDDLALAEELVDRLHTRKRLGRQAIVQELRRRGVEQSVIDQALEADGSDASDELARAVDVASQRARQLRGLDRQTAERRLSGFLMRKGYGSGAVRIAVERALDGDRPRGGVRFE
jgi:regulatory protein